MTTDVRFRGRKACETGVALEPVERFDRVLAGVVDGLMPVGRKAARARRLTAWVSARKRAVAETRGWERAALRRMVLSLDTAFRFMTVYYNADSTPAQKSLVRGSTATPPETAR